MRFVPIILMLVAVVVLMGSMGRTGSFAAAVREARSILIVIALALGLTVLFALLVNRAT